MLTKRFSCTAGLLLVALTCAPHIVAAQKGANEMAMPDRGRVRAPEFAHDRAWLNIAKPLSLAALRGKAVLLDFWT